MKRLYVCLLALLSTLFCACDAVTTSPEDYKKEIEDVVRYCIAEVDYAVDRYWEWSGSDSSFETSMDAMETYFLELYGESAWGFDEMLKHVSGMDSPYANAAKKILKNYQNLSISLTDYKPASTRGDYKSYTFKELHSGIEFVFELMDLDTDEPHWNCEPLDESMEKYVVKAMLK